MANFGDFGAARGPRRKRASNVGIDKRLDPKYREEHEERMLALAHRIFENDDGTVSLGGEMPRGKGSMYRIGLEGNIDKVNALSRMELHAVMIAVRAKPFPLGDEEEVLKSVFEQLRADPYSFFARGGAPWTMKLSAIRAGVLARAAQGMNAPVDTYLTAAMDLFADTRGPIYYEPEHLRAEYHGQQKFPFGDDMDDDREEMLGHVQEMYEYPDDPNALSYLRGMRTLLEDTGQGVPGIFEEQDYDQYEYALRLMTEQVQNASREQLRQYVKEFTAYVNEPADGAEDIGRMWDPDPIPMTPREREIERFRDLTEEEVDEAYESLQRMYPERSSFTTQELKGRWLSMHGK